MAVAQPDSAGVGPPIVQARRLVTELPDGTLAPTGQPSPCRGCIGG